MGRGCGGRRGRPRRQDMPIPDEIPAKQEVGQQAMGALAREMAGALREFMDILRSENQVQAHIAEAGPSFLKREFFRSNPDEFLGDPKEPLKADEWLEQMMKTFEMLGIEDEGLRVTLASFQLKGDVGQWFAPELVAFEERRCLEFEKKLRTGLKLRVTGSMTREHGRLVDAAVHLETIMKTWTSPFEHSVIIHVRVRLEFSEVSVVRLTSRPLDLFFLCLVVHQTLMFLLLRAGNGLLAIPTHHPSW
ncbi:hypothetical protein CsSME_00007809 [Camellia sinensis var. sinensis]